MNKARRAALWGKGKTAVLGNLADVEDWANGVNRLGVVVGYFIPRGGKPQSMRSPGDRHAAMWKEGRQVALSELGKNERSECEASNDDGVAVGWSGSQACQWKDGQVQAWQVIDGFDAKAHSINRDGVIVGESMQKVKKGGWRWIAGMWRLGRFVDLNALIPPRSGWSLCVATHISDNGLIVGYGSYAKYPRHPWRAFLLLPKGVRPGLRQTRSR